MVSGFMTDSYRGQVATKQRPHNRQTLIATGKTDIGLRGQILEAYVLV
jgi:hypothetical protein